MIKDTKEPWFFERPEFFAVSFLFVFSFSLGFAVAARVLLPNKCVIIFDADGVKSIERTP